MTKYGVWAKMKTQKKRKIDMTNWNKYISWALCTIVLSSLTFNSCTENTGSMGIYADADAIGNSFAYYNIYTKSALMDSVVSSGFTSFLGRITDPETGSEISADFATQFHTFEDYIFPEKNLLFEDYKTDHKDDKVKCDSIEIRLFLTGYYGDANNPMKIEVYPLSKEKILEEDSTYYVNTDLSKYVNAGQLPIATKVFTPRDFIISDAEYETNSYSNNIRIVLPKQYGDEILNAYYEHPDYFKDSYTFIRKICPGFLFKIKSGTETMIYTDVSTMNLCYSYYNPKEEGKKNPTICRFASTPEVIQSTQFKNDDLSSLVEDKSCTYLKTPAGICTEIELPINEIYAQHAGDSINMASLSFTRYNSLAETQYTWNIPSSILLVRKQDQTDFFRKHLMPNAQTSYVSFFNKSNNNYKFDNISRLITYCYYEKKKGMEDEQLNEKQWEEKHPNWNKVLVIPVNVSQTTDTYGNISYNSVKHDIKIGSTKLVGGPNAPLKMQVIYSHYK